MVRTADRAVVDGRVLGLFNLRKMMGHHCKEPWNRQHPCKPSGTRTPGLRIDVQRPRHHEGPDFGKQGHHEGRDMGAMCHNSLIARLIPWPLSPLFVTYPTGLGSNRRRSLRKRGVEQPKRLRHPPREEGRKTKKKHVDPPPPPRPQKAPTRLGP